MAETSTTTTRPTSYDDLTDWQKQGHQVAAVTPEFVVRYPSLGQHLLAALAEAEHLGMTVVDGVITIELTDDELQRKLKAEQRSWDTTRDWYHAAVADPSAIDSWKHSSINAWATREGLDPIAWDDEASS